MAVRETLELDLRGALQQINELERQIDDLRRPVDIPVDITGNAPTEIRAIDDRLDDIQDGARNVNRELGEMETSASSAVGDFSRLSNEMGVSEDSARGISREIEQARDAASRLDTATEGARRSIDRAEDEAGRLTRELLQADRAADAIDVTSIRLVRNFDGLKTAAGGIAGALAAVGGLQLFGGVARGANAAVQSFAQLEDSINAVNVIFAEGASTVRNFGETAASSAGLSQTAFNQAVTPIGSLLQNFGFDAQEAADASVILVQRAADLASVLGGSVNDALLAVGAALRGEADPLERYGASISAARVEQFALASGLAATKAAITPAITLQARYGLILEDTAKVQGDFVNTSGDLANAQKIAGAQAQDLAATIGEALAPAFEAVLVNAVPVLDFFESLTPALAESAEGASGAAAGISAFTSAVVLGFGGLGDVFGGVGDVLSGFPALFDDVAGALVDWDTDFSGVQAQMDDFNQRTANQFIRIASQSIPAAVAKGFTPINAFGQAIAYLAQQDDGLLTIQSAFERLRIQSGLTDAETQEVTRSLLAQQEALGFSAEEVAFLETQMHILNEALDDGGRANADYLESVSGFPGAFNTTTTAFTTFTNGLDEIPERMSTVIGETRMAAGLIGEALNPFTQAEEDLHVSGEEFFDNLIAEITAQATFQAGIAELVMREQFDLAAMLGEQGPKVQETLDDMLADVDLADAANEAIKTGATETSTLLASELRAAIASGNLAPEVEQAFIELLEAGIFTNSEVKGAIVDGTAEAANTTVSNYSDALLTEMDLIDATVLQDKLGALFSGVVFNISADQFHFPDSGSFQGTIGAGAVLGGGGGSSAVQVVINNPTTTDLPTNVAQATQSIGAAAATFNRIGGA